VCGACTVLLDGRTARSCLTFAVQVNGRKVDTVRSLNNGGVHLNDLQEAFRRHHGLQCGFCTPGILVSAEAFLNAHPSPSEQEVREMLSGHICRCTGYVGMVDAILETAGKRSGGAAKPGTAEEPAERGETAAATTEMPRDALSGG
jgi:aerobic-type carbon monoxide dehydrogenase small subunit (CoxS/CutS family)